jgi:hypothetical protein
MTGAVGTLSAGSGELAGENAEPSRSARRFEKRRPGSTAPPVSRTVRSQIEMTLCWVVPVVGVPIVEFFEAAPPDAYGIITIG